MGPKTAQRQKLAKNEREAVSFEEFAPPVIHEPPQVLDPYKGLRYEPQKRHSRAKMSIQVKSVPVMKKQKLATLTPTFEDDSQTVESSSTKYMSHPPEGHHRSLFRSQKQKEKEKYQLEMDVISTPPLTKWVAPSELPLLPPPIQVLQRRKPMEPSIRQLLDQNKRRENGHLDHYVQVKEEQLKMENYLMAATGKNRSNLLLRRKQLLPKIPPFGSEQPLIRLRRAESPIKDSAVCLFNISEHMKTERKGICSTMTKEKQGYTVVEEWVGCPEVTDLILEKLGLNHVDDLEEGEEEEGFSLTTKTQKTKFVPKVEKLGVLSNAKHQLKRSFTSEGKQTLGVLFSGKVKSQENWHSKRSGRHFSCSTAAERQSIFNFNVSGSSASLLIGDMAVSWSSEPEWGDQVWITEVGCTADLGQSEMCTIRLTNLGTTSINYKFVRKDHRDAFDLNKYRLTRFIIDSDEKTILPGETYRVPILYKSIEPGYYTEDWHVLTRPVMANGAEIIVRMWGITRSFDTFCHERHLIDTTLGHRETLAIVQDRLHKLVYNLLLKEASAVDERFKQELLGPDLFRYHNPSLHYHTSEVFRLGKLLEMLDDRKTKSATSKKSTNRIEYFEESNFNFESSKMSSGTENAAQVLSPIPFKDSEVDDEEEGDEEYLGIGLLDAVVDIASEHSSSRVTPLLTKKATVETWMTHLLRKINAELKTKNLIRTTDEPERYSPILNVANCDFAVDSLCHRILEEVDVLEEQDAYFRIVAQQLSKLFFRTETTVPNIGTTVAVTLLANTLDQFSEYALNLKLQCCETWLYGKTNTEKKERPEEFLVAVPEPVVVEVVPDSFVYEREEQQTVPFESLSNIATESTANVQEDYNVSNCEDFIPREDLDPRNYQSQYYDRIYTKMYLLLSEYFDSLDQLLSSDVKMVTQKQPEAILPGIQRLKQVTTRCGQIESLLTAPLPPLWVRLAQRMDAASNLINPKTSKSSHDKSVSDSYMI